MELMRRSTGLFYGVLIYLVGQCAGGEYCGYYTTYGNYEYEYCNGYCCDEEYDNCCTSWGWVAGAVVGGIVFLSVIGVIVFMICAKMKAKKNRTINVAMHERSGHVPYSTRNFNKPVRTHQQPPAYPAPPPPYTDTFNYGGGPYGAYQPPPPYPGPSDSYPGPNAGMQTTSLTSNDPAYPPPAPVS